MHLYFQVSKHKTDYVGPAQIALPGDLWRFTLAFVHCLRRMPGYQANQMRTTSIFLGIRHYDAEPVPLSTSGIDKALKRFWRIVYKGSTISATLLRKSVVTAVRTKQPLSRDVLARHMCHQPGTADR